LQSATSASANGTSMPVMTNSCQCCLLLATAESSLLFCCCIPDGVALLRSATACRTGKQQLQIEEKVKVKKIAFCSNCRTSADFAANKQLVPLPVLLHTMAAQNGTKLRNKRMAAAPRPKSKAPPNKSMIGFGPAPALPSMEAPYCRSIISAS